MKKIKPGDRWDRVEKMCAGELCSSSTSKQTWARKKVNVVLEMLLTQITNNI